MLTLIRGLPGSGKSHFGRMFVSQADNTVLLEADQFFLDRGVYQFDPTRLPLAHAWVLNETERHLANGMSPVVANTFCKIEEMLPYWELAHKFQHKVYVAEPPTEWAKDPEQCHQNCLHGVPLTTIQRRYHEWQHFPLGVIAADELESTINRYKHKIL